MTRHDLSLSTAGVPADVTASHGKAADQKTGPKARPSVRRVQQNAQKDSEENRTMIPLCGPAATDQHTHLAKVAIPLAPDPCQAHRHCLIKQQLYGHVVRVH